MIWIVWKLSFVLLRWTPLTVQVVSLCLILTAVTAWPMCLAFVLPVDGWNPALSESAKLWMVQKSQTTTRDVTKPCKWWDKLATPTGYIAGFLLSTVWNGEGGGQVLTKNQNKSVALSWKPMSSWMSLSFQQFLWKVAACFLINVISHTHTQRTVWQCSL